MGVPPTIVRRILVAPVVVAVEGAILVASPLLLVVAALASPFAGAWRPVRVLTIALSFASRHLAATLACLGLWIASGFGRAASSERMQRAYYAVLRWFVSGVYEAIARVARVQVRILESATGEEILSSGRRPVVVFSRHAGEGDTLLVIHQLLCRYGRRPRVVMHQRLRLDPLIDVLGGRLPHRFVDPRGGDTEVEIAAMASGLDERAAVLIFPEGGNFSARRREKGIERLEQRGHAEEAEWARRMKHVSALRPGGALAALEAAPGADAVFAGHVGFPTSLGEAWRLLPVDQTVEVRLWAVPAEEIPAGRDERIDWLFGRWCSLDDWVGSAAGDRDSLSS